MESIDQGLWNWFQSHRKPWIDSAVTAISLLGTPILLGSVAFLAMGVLLWKRRPVSAAAVCGTILISYFLVAVVQDLVGRERPEVGYRPLEPPRERFSFPSEHAWLAGATYLAVAWAVADLVPQARLAALGSAVALALAVGLSRLFVGACYPSDVIAGWFGGACVAALLRSALQVTRPMLAPGTKYDNDVPAPSASEGKR